MSDLLWRADVGVVGGGECGEVGSWGAEFLDIFI